MRILITAGPTVEPLDAVRFLSNRSSGRLGYEIAKRARARGHAVTLVSGPVALAAPRGVRLVRVESAREMLAACRREFRRADVLVMAAAVADYRPANALARKRHKQGAKVMLSLVRNPDLLAALCRRKGKRVAVGFALENSLSTRVALSKMRAKGCDAIVLNALPSMGGEGFRAVLLEGRRAIRLGPDKRRAAAKIVRWLESKAR